MSEEDERTTLIRNRHATDGVPSRRLRKLPKLRSSSVHRFLSSGEDEGDDDLEAARLCFASRFVAAAADGRDVETTDNVFESRPSARIIRSKAYRVTLLTVIVAHLAMPLWECSFHWAVIALKLLCAATYVIHVGLELAAFGRQHYLDKAWGGVFAVVASVQALTFVWSTLLFIRTREAERACGVVRVGQMVRPFLLVSQMMTLRRVFSNVLRTMYSTKDTLALGVVVLVFYAVLGVGLFNNEQVPGYDLDDDNFNTFGPALLSLYVLTTEENFPDVADPAFTARPKVAYVYFISFILFFMVVVLPLMLATVLDSYAHQHSAQIKRSRNKVRKALLVAYYVVDDDGVRGMNRREFERLMAGALPELQGEEGQRRIALLWACLPKTFHAAAGGGAGGDVLSATDFLELADLLHRKLGDAIVDLTPDEIELEATGGSGGHCLSGSTTSAPKALGSVLEDEELVAPGLGVLGAASIPTQLPPLASLAPPVATVSYTSSVASSAPVTPPGALCSGHSGSRGGFGSGGGESDGAAHGGNSGGTNNRSNGILNPVFAVSPVLPAAPAAAPAAAPVTFSPLRGSPPALPKLVSTTGSGSLAAAAAAVKEGQGDNVPFWQQDAQAICGTWWFGAAARANAVLLACASVLWSPQREERYNACLEGTATDEHSCLDFFIMHVMEGMMLVVFVCEVSVRGAAVGRRAFLSNAWARFDVFIAVVSVVGYTLAVWGKTAVYFDSHQRTSDLLELPRALRVLRIISVFGSLRRLAASLYNVASLVLQIALLYFCVTYSFAVLGMAVVGQATSDILDERYSFTTFPRSLLALFFLTVTNNWNDLLYPVIAQTSGWVSLYFVAYMLFCSTIMLDVLVGVVIEGFRVSHSGERRHVGDNVGTLWLGDKDFGRGVPRHGQNNGSGESSRQGSNHGNGNGHGNGHGSGSSSLRGSPLPSPLPMQQQRAVTPVYRFRKLTEQDMFRHRLAAGITEEEMDQLEEALRSVESQLHDRWLRKQKAAAAAALAAATAAVPRYGAPSPAYLGRSYELLGRGNSPGFWGERGGNGNRNGDFSSGTDGANGSSRGLLGALASRLPSFEAQFAAAAVPTAAAAPASPRLPQMPVPAIRRSSGGPREDECNSRIGMDAEAAAAAAGMQRRPAARDGDCAVM